jgi:hypothetical protein
MNDDDTPYFNKTPSAGDRAKWTFSCWFKLGNIPGASSTHGILVSGGASADQSTIRIDGQVIDWVEWDQSGSATQGRLITNRVFRDPTAWYHLVCTWDSDNGTEGSRMKMYINGVRETSFSTGTYPTSGYDSAMNSNVLHEIGRQSWNSSQYFDGYFAEMAFCDGQAYAASDFGEFDEDSPTIWKPKDISGLTFGSRGWYLDFEDSGDLDDDESGNGNDWTANNLAATDQAVDTPTNNFCTLNPLVRLGAHSTLSEGNCFWTLSSAGYESVHSTFAVNSGKWYCEFKFISGSHQYTGITASELLTGLYESVISGDSNIMYNHAGNKQIGNSSDGAAQSSYGSTYTSGDIVGMALDYDNNYMYFAKNNTWQNSGDPESGATGTGGLALPSTTHSYAFGMSKYASGGSGTAGANFGGCPPFSLSSAANDENGYGLFEYAPPDGFLALCSKNLGSDGG